MKAQLSQEQLKKLGTQPIEFMSFLQNIIKEKAQEHGIENAPKVQGLLSSMQKQAQKWEYGQYLGKPKNVPDSYNDEVKNLIVHMIKTGLVSQNDSANYDKHIKILIEQGMTLENLPKFYIEKIEGMTEQQRVAFLQDYVAVISEIPQQLMPQIGENQIQLIQQQQGYNKDVGEVIGFINNAHVSDIQGMPDHYKKMLYKFTPVERGEVYKNCKDLSKESIEILCAKTLDIITDQGQLTSTESLLIIVQAGDVDLAGQWSEYFESL